MIKILYFGQVAEATGIPSEMHLHRQELTAAELIKELQTRHPQLRQMSFRLAINKKIASDNTPIPAQTEVALLPPYAGG